MAGKICDGEKVQLGDAILQDISKWSGEKQEKITEAAKKIRNEMKSELRKVTPVRDYPHNNGVVMRIIVHRGGQVRKAKKEKAPDNRQPGSMRSGWANVNLKNKSGQTVFAVRNKNNPYIVHLVNSGHKLKSHNKSAGFVQGNRFVDKVQKNGQDKLDAEIKKILSE